MKKSYEIQVFNLETGKNDTVFYNATEGVNNQTWQDTKNELYNHDRQEALIVETVAGVVGQELAWKYELELRNDGDLYREMTLKQLFDKNYMIDYIIQNY